MGSLFALLAIIFISLLIVRIGTNALMMTGMSLTASQFQAASAFFGVGFTTSEAEMVVRHAVRRKIVLNLIIAGNIGITSALATLIITLFRGSTEDTQNLLVVFILLFVSAAAIYFLINTPFIKKPLDVLMRYWLERAGVVRALDYELLLNVQQGYSVSDFKIHAGHPFADKALHQSRPSDRGIAILGVTKPDGSFVGTPNKDEVLEPGDIVMVYGSEEAIEAMATPTP
ncbi:TrkA C-terminal domain-containing protein [Verrucomicrobiaceae bacterium N1E253]|uniref:TrkA C-terminal domain-containing protein n=1 Tax=Oceaniferula marina TaxID=2748318 RepID=A0A851GDU9_9BACT|nr:TrkA C-terminal domain-containing protein [Oceaniferula marina]NWK55339.1 TrkA C-terminal domain-containing protein [Oceaniferula marina]